MDGGASVRTKDRNKKTAEIERLHEKTFRAWANSQLRTRNLKIETSLADSFHDGLMLINLVEVLSGEKCTSDYHKAGTLTKDIHKLENITLALEFLSKFVKVNVNSKDIMDGNLKIILGVVWRLILTFQVAVEKGGEGKGGREKDAKLALLKWCQETTAGHKHVDIQNFQGSWFDGMAFCALVHAMDPSALDYDSLDPANAKENLTLAFKLAEKQLDIPQLLDPFDIIAEDPLSRPDEQCFITYISAFPIAMLHRERQANEERAKREALSDEDKKRRQAQLEEEQRRAAEAAAAAKRAQEEKLERDFEEENARLKRENEALKASLLDAKGKVVGRLQITVIQARRMKAGKVNAYVTLFCERQKERSRTVKKAISPEWNADFEFYVSDTGAEFELSLFDRHMLWADHFLGYVNIPISSLKDGEEVEDWFPLKKSRKKKHADKHLGEIALKVCYRKYN